MIIIDNIEKKNILFTKTTNYLINLLLAIKVFTNSIEKKRTNSLEFNL